MLVCYGRDGGTAQNLDPEEISYVPGYLRYLASESATPAMWTMPTEFDCVEWTLPVPGGGTVLALAKHITPRINSSVTYEDLARTIDGGGEGASEADIKASLLGACGSSGGMVGVKVDANAPAYHTPEYLASKARPEGIIVKLVRNPEA
jgi:hypothetical protein